LYYHEQLKFEIRIPKSETNTNDQNSKRLEHSNFEFVSSFGFSASDFKPISYGAYDYFLNVII
jgi:hypothetical protein